MSRRLLAPPAIALLAILLPLVPISAQVRVTGVLQGSLVLLPEPSASANVASSHVTAIAAEPPSGRAAEPPAGFARMTASPEAQPVAGVAPAPIKAVLSSTRDSLLVWAPSAQRIELRLEDDTGTIRTVECTPVLSDSAAATCDAERLPARATLTVYLRLDGSR